ncbi:hypothetical protein BH09CHL1_BH09CHL1_22170 [soil metagenome]
MIVYATTSIIEKRRTVAQGKPKGYILEVLVRVCASARKGAAIL